MVSGWGRTDAGGDSSSHLRTADVQVISLELCKEVYGRIPGKLERGIDGDCQICAGSNKDESNTCQVRGVI